MKKLLYSLLLLLCCCLIIVASSTTINESQPRTAMQDAGTILFLNGDPVVTTDHKGNMEPPLSYNGTTYIRLSGMEQLFGVSFIYDSDNNTVSVGDAVEAGPVYLTGNNEPESERMVWDAIDVSRVVQVHEHRGVKFVFEGNAESIMILVTESDIFLPLRAVASTLGYGIEWYDTQGSIEVMSPIFYASVLEFKQGVGELIPTETKDMEGLRNYILRNVYKDSSHVARFRFTRKNGEDLSNMLVDRSTQRAVITQRNKIQKDIDDIISDLKLEGLSSRDKVTKINSWVCSAYSYDTSVTEDNPMDGARVLQNILATDKQICEGYARLSVELCRAAGVRAQYLVGYVNILGQWRCHAWYRTFIDGKWLYTDPTICDSSKNKQVALLKTIDELSSIRKESSVGIKY